MADPGSTELKDPQPAEGKPKDGGAKKAEGRRIAAALPESASLGFSLALAYGVAELTKQSSRWSPRVVEELFVAAAGLLVVSHFVRPGGKLLEAIREAAFLLVAGFTGALAKLYFDRTRPRACNPFDPMMGCEWLVRAVLLGLLAVTAFLTFWKHQSTESSES